MKKKAKAKKPSRKSAAKSRQSVKSAKRKATAPKRRMAKPIPKPEPDPVPVKEPTVDAPMYSKDENPARAPGHRPLEIAKQFTPTDRERTRDLTHAAQRRFTKGDKVKIARSMQRRIMGR